MERRRYAIAAALLALIAVALLLRLGWVARTEVIGPVRADAAEYVEYAGNLLRHGVFGRQGGPGDPRPDNYRTPGYPAFLALVMGAGGERDAYRNILTTQALLGVLLVPLAYFVARRFLPPLGSLLAAGLTAISPHLVAMGGYLLSEAHFAHWLLLALALFLLAWEARAGKAAPAAFAASGAAFGAAYLVTPTIFFFPFLLAALAFLLLRREGSRRLLPLGAFLAAFTLFWGGYALRNAVSVAPGDRGSRLVGNIAFGSYPDFIFRSPQWQYYPYREDPEWGEFAGSWEGFLPRLAARMKAEPGRYLRWFTVGKPLSFWSWRADFQGGPDIYVYDVKRSLYQSSPPAAATRSLMRALHPALLLLALAGAVWLAARLARRGMTGADLPAVAVFSLLVYYTLLFLVFAPLPRFAIPLRPALFIAAAWTSAQLLALPARGRKKGGPP